MPARFMTLADVAEVLAVSERQVYALVRNRDLPAVKIGGKGAYRVERPVLEEWIKSKYAETDRFLREHPLAAAEADLAGEVDARS